MTVGVVLSTFALAVRFFLYRDLRNIDPSKGTILDKRDGITGAEVLDIRVTTTGGKLVIVTKADGLPQARLNEGDSVDVWVLPDRPGQSFLHKPSTTVIVISGTVIGIIVLWFFLVPFLFYLKGTIGR